MSTFTYKSKSILAALVMAFSTGSVMAQGYPLEMENDLIAVCEAIKGDSRVKFKRAVKATGLDLKTLHAGLVCNGQDMMTFAASNGAANTSRLIANRLNLQDTTLTAQR